MQRRRVRKMKKVCGEWGRNVNCEITQIPDCVKRSVMRINQRKMAESGGRSANLKGRTAWQNRLNFIISMNLYIKNADKSGRILIVFVLENVEKYVKFG